MTNWQEDRHSSKYFSFPFAININLTPAEVFKNSNNSTNYSHSQQFLVYHLWLDISMEGI